MRERFLRARRAGKQYERQLRAVAKQVGLIVDGYAPGGVVRSQAQLNDALDRYSQILRPWSKEVSQRMIDQVAKYDEAAWSQLARSMGRELRKEIHSAPTGLVTQLLLDEQVELITSLPIHAGRRVHKLTLEALSTGERADVIAKEILRTGHVTESRAKLIARTEVARTASMLTQSRAEYVGSEGYIWRTVGDSDVRELHRHMEGKYVAWDDPPPMEPSLGNYHAGQGPNCRCYPEPVIPDIIK